jgi:hypothetical protein
MKFAFNIILLLGFLALFSCEDNNNIAPTTRQYVGNYDALITGGFQTGNCKMEISQNGSNLRIRIHDNRVEIDPDIFVDVRQNSNGDLEVIPCSNSCYQGDANITSGTLVTNSNGKIRLQFNVRPNGLFGNLQTLQITVTEI